MKDRTIPLLLQRIAMEYPDITAQSYRNADKVFENISYGELFKKVLNLASGLIEIGCRKNDNIGLIADNRNEWFHISNAILAIGAADVPRGCDATEQEITYILSFAECKTAFLENKAQVSKVLNNKKDLPLLKTLITIDEIDVEELKKETDCTGIEFFSYAQIMEIGTKAGTEKAEILMNKGSAEDLATVIFTSGTTGQPKGVMLSHKNFIAQLDDLKIRIKLEPGEGALSVLPVWHSFERECEYVILASAGKIIYSKPIGSVLLADLAEANPALMPSVPRIWEAVYDGIYKKMRKEGGISLALFSFFVGVGILWGKLSRNITGRRPYFNKAAKMIYPVLSVLPAVFLAPLYFLGDLLVFRKIRQKLGKNFKAGVSGGGALPPNIDEFFWATRIRVVEGYGITEAAPVVSVRFVDRPIFGTIGDPIACVKAKIIDKNGNEAPVGKKGVLYIKGDSIMSGYYKSPEKTAEVMDSEGWFNTGDIAVRTVTGELILKGRTKNTIVLRGGENIEPAPIELKLQESPFIKIAVVLGSDQRYLAALLVVDKDTLQTWADNNGIKADSFSEIVKHPDVQKKYEQETADLISARNGFKLFERINKIALLEEEFQVGKELSAKQEIMRHKVESIYKQEIAKLFEPV